MRQTKAILSHFARVHVGEERRARKRKKRKKRKKKEEKKKIKVCLSYNQVYLDS